MRTPHDGDRSHNTIVYGNLCTAVTVVDCALRCDCSERKANGERTATKRRVNVGWPPQVSRSQPAGFATIQQSDNNKPVALIRLYIVLWL